MFFPIVTGMLLGFTLRDAGGWAFAGAAVVTVVVIAVLTRAQLAGTLVGRLMLASAALLNGAQALAFAGVLRA